VSDNVFIYLAAADELQLRLQSERLTEEFGRKGVQWQFIPSVPLGMVDGGSTLSN